MYTKKLYHSRRINIYNKLKFHKRTSKNIVHESNQCFIGDICDMLAQKIGDMKRTFDVDIIIQFPKEHSSIITKWSNYSYLRCQLEIDEQ